MNTRPLAIASLVLAAVMAAFAFLTEARLPEGALLPTHWNAAGEPDDWAPALQALLFPVGLILFVTLIFSFIPRLEPLQDRLDGSAPVLRASWGGLLGTAAIIQLAVALPAYGIDPPITIVPLAVGLLFILLGNVLPKSRPGFFVGIRTPWAIIDTDNWIATHRLGGKLMLLAGIAIVVASILPLSADLRASIVIGAVVLVAIPPFLFSWWLWERKKAA